MFDKSRYEAHDILDFPAVAAQEAEAGIPVMILYSQVLDLLQLYGDSAVITDVELLTIFSEHMTTIQRLTITPSLTVPIDIAVYFYIYLTRRLVTIKRGIKLDFTSVRAIMTGAMIAAVKMSYDNNFKLSDWYANSGPTPSLSQLAKLDRDHSIAIKFNAYVSQAEAQFVLDNIEERMFANLYLNSNTFTYSFMLNESIRLFWEKVLMLCSHYQAANKEEKESPKLLALFKLLLLLARKSQLFNPVDSLDNVVSIGERFRDFIKSHLENDHELIRDDIWPAILALYRHFKDAMLLKLKSLEQILAHHCIDTLAYRALRTILDIHRQARALSLDPTKNIIVNLVEDLLIWIAERVGLFAQVDIPCADMGCDLLRQHHLVLMKKIDDLFPLLQSEPELCSELMKLQDQVSYLMVRKFRNTLRRHQPLNQSFTAFNHAVAHLCDLFIDEPEDDDAVTRNAVVSDVVSLFLTKTPVFFRKPIVEIQSGDENYIKQVIDTVILLEEAANKMPDHSDHCVAIQDILLELKLAVLKEIHAISERAAQIMELQPSLNEFWNDIDSLYHFCLDVDEVVDDNREMGHVVLRLLLTLSRRKRSIFNLDGGVNDAQACALLVEEIQIQLRHYRKNNPALLADDMYHLMTDLVNQLQNALVGDLIVFASQMKIREVDKPIKLWSTILQIYNHYIISINDDSKPLTALGSVFLLLVEFEKIARFFRDGEQVDRRILCFIEHVKNAEFELKTMPEIAELYSIICFRLKQSLAAMIKHIAVEVTSDNLSSPLYSFWKEVLTLCNVKNIFSQPLLIEIFILITEYRYLFSDSGDFNAGNNPGHIRQALIVFDDLLNRNANKSQYESIKPLLLNMSEHLRRVLGANFLNMALIATADPTLPLVLQEFYYDWLTLYAYCFHTVDDAELDSSRNIKSKTAYNLFILMASSSNLFSASGEFLFYKTTKSKNDDVYKLIKKMSEATSFRTDTTIWPTVGRLHANLQLAVVSEQGIFSRSNHAVSATSASSSSLPIPPVVLSHLQKFK